MADFEARGERDRFSTLRRRFAEGVIGTDDIDWLCDLVDAADDLAAQAETLVAQVVHEPDMNPSTSELTEAVERYRGERDA